MNIGCRILVVSALLGLSTVGLAQNLDPTVVVSRDYEGKLMEVHKPKLEMAVPDSVLRFDLDFDYSVSDSPYKGAYDFTPYLLDMRPSPVIREAGRLYLNAGAGYQLRPEMDLIWSPSFKNNAFRMNLFARHRSYIGQYWDLAPADSDGSLVFDRAGKDMYRNGTDIDNKAGIDGRYDWKKGVLRFNAGYSGFIQQDKADAGVSRNFNAVDVAMSLNSKDRHDTAFGYMLSADYRYSGDELTAPESASLSESIFGLDASVTVSLKKAGRLNLDVDYDMTESRGCFNSYASLISFAPHYVRMSKKWDIDLGLKVAKVLRADDMPDMYQHRIQSVYPDVKAGLKTIPSVYLYAAVTGGPELKTYSSLLASDRRVNMSYAGLLPGMLDVGDERLKAVLGLDGRITTRFSYSLKGGYAIYGNTPLQAMTYLPSEEGDVYMPSIAYVKVGKAFAALDCRLSSERFDMDASVEYSYFGYKEQFAAFLPASLVGDVSFRYNWMKRIYAGVSCEAAMSRKGFILDVTDDGESYMDAVIPGYADLGVDLEFVFNRRISVWAKGWNLLGMTVQRSLFYAEKGPGFTVGFCLNL